jgi:antirestriction protein ArdC
MTPQIEESSEATANELSRPRRDLRQEVTDQIIQALERGTAPWQKPWKAGSLEMPFNPTTKNAYRGGNALKGYEDPRWLTYKQAMESGWQVRQNEKGTQIEYWEYRAPETRGDGRADASSEQTIDQRQRPIHRIYTVFNGQQIEGIPAHQPKHHPEWEVVQCGEQILENSGAKILHDQNDAAFYSRAEDRIHLPPKAAFEKPGGYYGAALHKVAHWSGHLSTWMA